LKENSESIIKIDDVRVLSDDTRLKILMLLKRKGKLKLSEISKITGKTRSTVFEHLKILMKSGLVDREEGDRGHLYFLTEKGIHIISMIEDGEYKVTIEGVEKKHEFKLSRVFALLDQLTMGKIHFFFSMIAGLLMAILGYVHLASIVVSIIVGVILGLFEIDFRGFIESAIIFSVFTSISAIIREGALSMILVLPLAFIVYMIVGGITWRTVKLIIEKKKW